MTRFHKNRPHIVVATGFGNTQDMMKELEEGLMERVEPQSFEVLTHIPRAEASHPPEKFIDPLCKRLSALDHESVLVGYSYGALLALAAACRLEFRNVSDIFLIDGPLRSNIDVPSIQSFKEFSVHYEHRKTIAQECEAVLSSLHHPRIVAMGSRADSVVPWKAKFLNGDQFGWIELSDETTTIPFKSSGSSNVLYPPSHDGHALLGKRVDLVTDIIRWTLELDAHAPKSDKNYSTQECGF